MSVFYVPNAGNADTFLLALDTAEGTRYIVMDGGDRKRGTPLPELLRENGIKHLDAVIVTHFHQDHLGLLPEVTEEIAVDELVVPYPPIAVDSHHIAAFFAETPQKIAQKQNEIQAYNQMLNRLATRGTKICFSFSPQPIEIRIGEYVLRQLYPLPGMSSEIYAIISGRDSNGVPDPNRRKEFANGINGDSSIWLLEKNGEQLLYLPGDAVLDSQMLTVQREMLHPVVVKLSHHGVNSKGKVYFSRELMESLSPQLLVITNDREGYETCGAMWRELTDAEMLITGLLAETKKIQID